MKNGPKILPLRRHVLRSYAYRAYTMLPPGLRAIIRPGGSSPERLQQYFDRVNFPDWLGLSISAVCQAKCIFCPETRARTISPKFMDMALVERILDEAEDAGFRGVINIGENGEASLHPNFTKLLELVSSRLPDSKLVLHSNMANIDPETASIILGCGVSSITFNIDGATKSTYEHAKGLNHERVTGNIIDFLSIREKDGYETTVNIGILTPRDYYRAVGDRRYRLFEKESGKIIGQWAPRLRRDDTITVLKGARVVRWAEPEKTTGKEMKKPCPIFYRLLTDCFIAPSGKFYICCYDHRAQNVLGDLNRQSITDIWNSELRKEKLLNLKRLNFKDAGPPCLYCPA